MSRRISEYETCPELKAEGNFFDFFSIFENNDYTLLEIENGQPLDVVQQYFDGVVDVLILLILPIIIQYPDSKKISGKVFNHFRNSTSTPDQNSSLFKETTPVDEKITLIVSGLLG